MRSMNTADLCDAYGDAVRVAAPIFKHYGGKSDFHGPIATIAVKAQFIPVREMLQSPGGGRVLVIDGGGATNVALLGDRLAELAVSNGWAGIVVNGCIRDAAAIAGLDIGVKALNTNPRRPGEDNTGRRGVDVSFAGIVFRPGEYLYADLDGVVVSDVECQLPLA